MGGGGARPDAEDTDDDFELESGEVALAENAADPDRVLPVNPSTGLAGNSED